MGHWKVTIDARTDEILGAALQGHEAGEVLAALQMAMLGHPSYPRVRDAAVSPHHGRGAQPVVRHRGATAAGLTPLPRRHDAMGNCCAAVGRRAASREQPYRRTATAVTASGPSSSEPGTDGPRILLASVDGRATSMRAGAYAAGFARRQRARLVAVHLAAPTSPLARPVTFLPPPVRGFLVTRPGMTDCPCRR